MSRLNLAILSITDVGHNTIEVLFNQPMQTGIIPAGNKWVFRLTGSTQIGASPTAWISTNRLQISAGGFTVPAVPMHTAKFLNAPSDVMSLDGQSLGAFSGFPIT